MKRSVFIMFFALLLMFTACSKDDDVSGPSSVLYQVGDIKIPVLSGNYIEMGMQMGELMGGRIRELYRITVDERIDERAGLSFGYMLSRANVLWDNVIPSGMKGLCDGLTMTGGLTLDQLKVLQTINIILQKQSGCSSIILWGDYADGGALLFGHNTDDPDALLYSNLLCVTVFKPSNSEHQFATIGYPGIFSVTAGANDTGLVVALNSAPMACALAVPDFSVPWRALRSFEWLGCYGSLAELRAVYQPPVSIGCNYLAADAFSGACFETAVDMILERQTDADGLMCETNHFVHHLLQGHNNAYYGGVVFLSSHKRLQNLRNKASEFKGILTSRRLMENVLSVPENQGGVNTINTVRSFVFRPVDQQLLIRTPGTSEPVEINLNNYFD